MGEDPTQPSRREPFGGRYAVESELGHGGMGRVLRARDLKPEGRRAEALRTIDLPVLVDFARP